MARPKEFDQDLALEGAMEVFWQRGYQGTSIQDLVDHIGVNRQSLYDTFGDKQQLYQSALARYRLNYAQETYRALQAKGNVKIVLQNFFIGFVDYLSSPNGRSCMMVHATLECSEEDKATSRCVYENLHELIQHFETLLERGKTQGELPPKHHPKSLAHYFANVVQGLNVSAKAGLDHKALMNIVRVALSVLD
jgi:TetR/AcrR family transcriptional regulator, transcriptional repressor for nem operon